MNAPRPRVLVVDDDVDACQNLSDILTDFDYAVDVAHDGQSALRFLEHQAYDVALMDLRMPDMDGITLFRELQRIRPETVAILITAYASRETERTANREGVLQVLSKPVQLNRLLPVIAQTMQQPLVLVVDDDTEMCRSLKEILTERGYRVGLAHSAHEATEKLRELSFRVLLIDVRLPDANGAQFSETIRAAYPAARVILITGFREEAEDLIQQALTSHADAVCYKPFDVGQLFLDIRRLSE